MSKYIDADLYVEMQIYDDEHEEWSIWSGTIEDLLDQWTEQGCPPTIEVSEDCISRAVYITNLKEAYMKGHEDGAKRLRQAYMKGYEDGRKSIEVSEDAISREYLEEQLQQIEDITAMAHIDLGENPYDETEEITMPISTVRKIFKKAPSVVPSCQKNRQVERAEGEWIEEIGDCEGKTVRYICSNCGDDDGWINYNFCPICGAKMKGEAE